MTELGNTTERDHGILTGIDGLRAALWEAVSTVAPHSRKPRRLEGAGGGRMILFLDDSPERHHQMTLAHGDDVVHAFTIDQFVDVLFAATEPFSMVSLDHDLNDFDCHSFLDGREATGLDACGLMVGNSAIRDKLPPTIHIHSVNPCGAQAMRSFLRAKGFEVRWIPFACQREADETERQAD